MKLKIFSLLILFVAAIQLQAQDGQQHLKTAGKALSAYNLDQSGNADKLMEAKDAIELAFKDSEIQNDYKANVARAKIYTELIAKDYIAMSIGKQEKPNNAGAGVEALAAIETALPMAEKKYQVKEVLKILGELTPYLSFIGNHYIGTQDFETAYEPLSAVLDANQMLLDNDEKSVFESDADLDNHKYVTAVCARQAGEQEAAASLLQGLYDSGSKEPGVYSTLYAMTVDDDEEAAMKILKKGQEIDPTNTELLFAEINYYIKKGDFTKLEEKLKIAIEQDPDNPTVYSALGNVYMNLSESAMKEGNEAERQKYFDQALSYYNQTIERDANSFDAYYSIGSMYFNQAAEKTKVMQDLGLSKEDQKKYTMLEGETKDLFDTALPYFQKAERANPNDLNTLIALKEIYARQNDFEKSNIFKTRFEQVQAGETLEESYFKE